MNKKPKLLGLDYGSKTVGVALSDELGLLAHPFKTIFRERESKLRQTIAELRKIIEDHNIEKIILGLPVNSDGSFGVRVNKTLEFKELLSKKLGLPIILIDESLSTVEANEVLFCCNIPASKQKQYLDSIAAAVVLQEYLNNKDSFDKEKERYE